MIDLLSFRDALVALVVIAAPFLFWFLVWLPGHLWEERQWRRRRERHD